MATAQKRISSPGTVNAVTTAHVRLELPEHVFDQYSGQAEKSGGRDPEVVMAERLIRCANQVESGLYFNQAEKKRLEACVGHMVADAQGALQRLEPLSRINVSDVTIRLDPVVLQRLSTRCRRGQTIQQLITEQTVKALKQYVGMLPY
jgi:hypothetical protein